MLKTQASQRVLLPPTAVPQSNRHESKKQTLFNAVLNNQLEQVKHLLTQGMNPNLTNTHGQTLLSIAARDGYTSIATELLHHGANLTLRTRCGNTPLYLAVVGSHYDIAKLLLLQQMQQFKESCTFYKVLRRLNAHALTLIQQSLSFRTLPESESYRHEKVELLVLLMETLSNHANFVEDTLFHAITSLERRFENALYHAESLTQRLFLSTLKCVHTGDARGF